MNFNKNDKILIAPDKFKGSLTAFDVSDALIQGIHSIHKSLNLVSLPLADGGEGTAEILSYHTNGHPIHVTVHDPLMRPINSGIHVSGDGKVAYVEMARASGLALLAPAERNALHTTTYGTGEQILHAISHKPEKIILCIGGSATNDGGTGMATVLGYRFYDRRGKLLQPVGKDLVNIQSIDCSGVNPLLSSIAFEVACDVTNPLTGPSGASNVYGPQKGVTGNDLLLLDDGLENLAYVIRKDLQKDIKELPGSGAAGGLGGGAVAFLNARIISGIELVMSISQVRNHVSDARLVISGEGKIDRQTLSGKVVKGISDECQKSDVPLVLVCGRNEISMEQFGSHLTQIYSIINRASSEKEAISKARQFLITIGKEIGQLIKLD
ncbi:MAG: glycerate kinase [Cyclobacteriaceae bacterium]|nr:glycerate kinase [Cyclobacteriaceae bacterium]